MKLGKLFRKSKNSHILNNCHSICRCILALIALAPICLLSHSGRLGISIGVTSISDGIIPCLSTALAINTLIALSLFELVLRIIFFAIGLSRPDNLSNKLAHVPLVPFGNTTEKQYQLIRQPSRPHGLSNHGNPEPALRRLSPPFVDDNPSQVHQRQWHAGHFNRTYFHRYCSMIQPINDYKNLLTPYYKNTIPPS